MKNLLNGNTIIIVLKKTLFYLFKILYLSTNIRSNPDPVRSGSGSIHKDQSPGCWQYFFVLFAQSLFASLKNILRASFGVGPLIHALYRTIGVIVDFTLPSSKIQYENWTEKVKSILFLVAQLLFLPFQKSLRVSANFRIESYFTTISLSFLLLAISKKAR